jgi:predicted NBD/HSP70 family sugar kinase
MNTNPGKQLRKTQNEIRLLNLIREEGPMTRSEIARRIHISKVSVWEIIGRLIESGFIVEIGKGESTFRGGKRPRLLQINADNGCVIGVEIRREYSRVALANICSDITKIEEIPHRAGATMDDVLPRLFEKIDLMLDSPGIGRDKLISCGIGLPGFVDYEKGELAFADTLQGWANLPLTAQFRARYSVPVFIENDVNAITLGECLLGAGQGYNNVVCIWIGEGIGAGLLVNGKIVRGEYSTAGEIGYLNLNSFCINEKQVKHLYSNQQFLGDILSEQHLLQVLMDNVPNGMPDPENKDSRQHFAAYFKRAEEGDLLVRAIFDEYIFLLANVCLVFIKTINAGVIVLSGHVGENSDYLINGVRGLVKEGMMNIPFQQTKIVAGVLRDQAGVKGTISLALQAIYGTKVIHNKRRKKTPTQH